MKSSKILVTAVSTLKEFICLIEAANLKNDVSVQIKFQENAGESLCSRSRKY